MQHVGKRIKAIVDDSKYSAKEIAEKMGTSFQNIYRLFEKESVETKYLYNIAETLSIPITQFFEEESRAELSEEINSLKGQLHSQTGVIEQLQKENAMLLRLFEDSEEKLKKREKLYDFLEKFFAAAQIDKGGFNELTTGNLFMYAQSLLSERDLSSYLLINKMIKDPEIIRLIEYVMKDQQPPTVR